MLVVAGTTNVSTDIRAMTAAGAALTGKVAADFTIWYRRDAAKEAIVLSDLTALTDAHSDGGVLEIGDGWYRLDLPDLATAVGVNRVAVGGSVDGGVVVSAPISLLGAVASVTGDVGGKVLGGGSGTITGTGARAVDASGNNLATAASITTIDTLLDSMAPVIIGTSSGSPDGTEVFVYGGVTVTSTVDDDGNRSSVVIS
jgi:hypothetical protein